MPDMVTDPRMRHQGRQHARTGLIWFTHRRGRNLGVLTEILICYVTRAVWRLVALLLHLETRSTPSRKNQVLERYCSQRRWL